MLVSPEEIQSIYGHEVVRYGILNALVLLLLVGVVQTVAQADVMFGPASPTISTCIVTTVQTQMSPTIQLFDQYNYPHTEKLIQAKNGGISCCCALLLSAN